MAERRAVFEVMYKKPSGWCEETVLITPSQRYAAGCVGRSRSLCSFIRFLSVEIDPQTDEPRPGSPGCYLE